MLDAAEVDWDLSFADCGDEALEILRDNEDIQAIVTDMKMPGMDGAELLEHVCQQHPSVVRIVLSGEADKHAVFRAVNPMHRYLSKPCDAETLVDTVRRASALRDLLDDDSLRELIAGIEKLPSIPSVYHNLMELLRSDDCSLNEIGKTIEHDPALAAKVLQIANSSIFGVRHAVTDVRVAASIMGLETIKTLALAFGTFEQFHDFESPAFSPQKLNEHSVRVAELAKQIAVEEEQAREFAGEAYAAALLHDVGKLALLAALPEKYLELMAISKESGTPLWQAELEAFGASHASVGAYLLSMWGVPQTIVEVVGLHHTPNRADERQFSVLSAVVAANQIEHQSDEVGDLSPNCNEYFQQVGCLDRLDKWQVVAQGIES